MTREEAIYWLENGWNHKLEGKYREAFDLALSALRPVTREQVEKWRGEWILVRRMAASAEFKCSKCQRKMIFADRPDGFCGRCGAPMTDEAVQMTMKRMKKLKDAPTLTPPNASPDLISRSALLRGETEPEITTGSDSELAEHMEWERWMDKIKRAPAAGKEAAP